MARAAGIAAVIAARGADPPPPTWREEFAALPAGAELRGRPGVRPAVFEVVDSAGAENGRALRMTADRASAAMLLPVAGVDLRRAPILRWRWRVVAWPTGADGRRADRDDQAIGIYVGRASGFRRPSLAYRWETDTPAGATGTALYAAGVVRVHWECLRNKNDGGEFVIEERNIAKDWARRIGGDPPESFAISISCNSQYTGTRAVAELDWIEFRSAPPP